MTQPDAATLFPELEADAPTRKPAPAPDWQDYGAEFDATRTYRYRLWRRWNEGSLLNFLMLNPSTADESANDPTIARCEVRARKLNYGGLVVTNLFAYRATLPRDMKAAADPIGPENDRHIIEVACDAGLVICAWGNDGEHLGRSKHVLKRLRQEGVRVYALKVGKTGEPYHPLYLSYGLEPREFRGGKLGPFCPVCDTPMTEMRWCWVCDERM